MKHIAYALLLTAALNASAQQPDRFPVTQHQVAHALLLHGLDVADDQVSMVASIIARSNDPLLDVDSAQAMGANGSDPRLRAKVKLSCREPRACLPFFAVVTLPGSNVLPALSTLDRSVRLQPAASISMHAGSHATLLVETANMHISMPVISLQNGPVGAQIRVTSPDRHQTWTATILSPTLLTGSL